MAAIRSDSRIRVNLCSGYNERTRSGAARFPTTQWSVILRAGRGRDGTGALVIYSGHVGPPPNLPRLSAFAEPGKVIVRWSTNFPGLKLYSTPRLGDPWQLVTSNVPVQGDSYSFTNTRPVGTSVFYKLSSN